ncbi:MAG: spore protease YyaC [Clostridiaceae bacterium]|nr:spore protease YyaC [Clostridiaceae bacterium]
MKLWEWIGMRTGQEVYYYHAGEGFETDKLATRLYQMIAEELKNQNKSGVLILCIGTDRSTGDSLGPLIGYKLKEKKVKNLEVFGTLERPVHAMNLEEYLAVLKYSFPNHLVVAVDASVGNNEHVGYITLGKGSLRPGLGVSKELVPVGDIFITGIVGGCAGADPIMLQSIRLAVVMRLADCISDSIFIVEKLCESAALV